MISPAPFFYIVSFMSASASGYSAKGDGRYETTETLLYGTRHTVHDAPALDGFTFAGWKDDRGKTWKPGDLITVTGDVTLTAQWLQNQTGETEKPETCRLSLKKTGKGTATVSADTARPGDEGTSIRCTRNGGPGDGRARSARRGPLLCLPGIRKPSSTSVFPEQGLPVPLQGGTV